MDEKDDCGRVGISLGETQERGADGTHSYLAKNEIKSKVEEGRSKGTNVDVLR